MGRKKERCIKIGVIQMEQLAYLAKEHLLILERECQMY